MESAPFSRAYPLPYPSRSGEWTDDGNESNGFFKVLRNGEEVGLFERSSFVLLLCRLNEKKLPEMGVVTMHGGAEWHRARTGNPGREELQRLGKVQSQGARVWRHGCGETEDGGHCYLVTKQSHTIVLFSALERVGACYLPEGLRSLWQPHIWAPESRCAVSRSHSRMMRQTLGSPVLAPAARTSLH